MNFKTKFWPNRSEKYDMGLWSVIALGIGSVVGAGIFALLGQVIMSAGYWTYGAFAVAGTAALFSGYSYGELAARYPDAGGLTDYFRRAFSCKCVSGTLSLIYMLTSAVSISMMAKSFGIYFTALLKGTDYGWMTVNEFAAVLIVGLALLNMMSAGDVGRAEILLVTLKILILGSLIGAAMWNADLTLSNVLPQPTLMSFWELSALRSLLMPVTALLPMRRPTCSIRNEPSDWEFISLFWRLWLCIWLWPMSC